MRSPFRSEARAFRFVLVVAAAAAAGTIAIVWAPTVIGATVAALSLAAVVGVYFLGGPRRSWIPAAPAHLGPADEWRLLLLILDGPPDEASLGSLRGRADRVLVLRPAATSPLRHWISDVDRARERSREQVEDAVARLRGLQVEAAGVVGDDDTFAAIDDALRTFGGDEIVVAGGDEGLIASLRARYALPVEPWSSRERTLAGTGMPAARPGDGTGSP